MSIKNDKKQEKKKIVFKFPSNIFGKSKKNNDNTEVMKTIKQELKDKEDYKPELTVLEKYELSIELLLYLSSSNFEKAKELIERGINVNAKDENGNTAIMFAAQNAPIEILKLLIEKGAEINIQNYRGETPLILVSRFFNKKEIVEFLINNGADINVQDDDGNTAIMFAAQNAPIEILKLLIENGAEINIRNHEGKTPLILAAIFNEKEIVEFLINNGAQKDETNYSEETPLMHASEYGSFENVKKLIEMGAYINHVDHKGRNALMHTFIWSYEGDETTEISEYLIKNGINIKRRDVYGRNILYYILENGDLSTLKHFISEYDLDSSEEEMFSCFEESIGNNEKSKYLLEYLIDNFPTENTIDKIIDLKLNGKSINVQLIKILIEETGMVNKKNSEGNTLLHAACERKGLDIIEFLIENGADITIKNHDGKTPYMLAFEKSDDETIEKIIEVLNKNNQEELASELQEMLTYGFKIDYNDMELNDENLY